MCSRQVPGSWPGPSSATWDSSVLLLLHVCAFVHVYVLLLRLPLDVGLQEGPFLHWVEFWQAVCVRDLPVLTLYTEAVWAFQAFQHLWRLGEPCGNGWWAMKEVLGGLVGGGKPQCCWMSKG